MQFYILMANSSGTMYVHSTNQIVNFTQVKGPFPSRKDAEAYLRLVISNTITELMVGDE